MLGNIIEPLSSYTPERAMNWQFHTLKSSMLSGQNVSLILSEKEDFLQKAINEE